MAAEISDELLDVLVCPQTHARLIHSGAWLYSTDAGTRLKYPIRDGIPIMLVEESAQADEAEHARVMATAAK